MANDPNAPPLRDHNAITSPEGFTTLNISGQRNGISGGIAEDYRRQIQSSARWFYGLAALSLINSIAALMGSKWGFLAGLGVTQLISGFALGLSEGLGVAVMVVAFIMNTMVGGICVLFGLFAQKRQNWAFVIGLSLYALDGLVFLFVQDWFSLAFHAYVFYCIYRGLAANSKLKTLESDLALNMV